MPKSSACDILAQPDETETELLEVEWKFCSNVIPRGTLASPLYVCPAFKASEMGISIECNLEATIVNGFLSLYLNIRKVKIPVKEHIGKFALRLEGRGLNDLDACIFTLKQKRVVLEENVTVNWEGLHTVEKLWSKAPKPKADYIVKFVVELTLLGSTEHKPVQEVLKDKPILISTKIPIGKRIPSPVDYLRLEFNNRTEAMVQRNLFVNSSSIFSRLEGRCADKMEAVFLDIEEDVGRKLVEFVNTGFLDEFNFDLTSNLLEVAKEFEVEELKIECYDNLVGLLHNPGSVTLDQFKEIVATYGSHLYLDDTLKSYETRSHHWNLSSDSDSDENTEILVGQT